MPGMDHMLNALVLAGGLAARDGTLGLENCLGHMAASSHGVARAAEAKALAEGSVPTNVVANLAAWLAALDARYAAGATPGPIISGADAREALGISAKDACLAMVRVTQRFHGTEARALLHDTVWAVATNTAVKAAVTAEIDLWLADIDARYAAGVTATPPGATQAAGVLACQNMAATAAGEIVPFEAHHQHFASDLPPGLYHGVTVETEAASQADAWVATDAATQLAFLLIKWDARFAAHA